MPTALIVEDEPEANKLLGMLLQLRGYQTESAFTGEEALRCVEARHPDIIFLDLMLPDINGYEVCKVLKSSKTTSLIPLVVVTARIAEENRIESYCVGADDFIPKPYTPDQIFDALDQASAWRNEFRADVIRGAVSLDGNDFDSFGDALRRLAQIRSLVIARTNLSLESVSRISLAIKEVWSRAEAWSRTQPAGKPATLTFTLSGQSLILTFCDVAGWLDELSSGFRADPNSALAAAEFDELIADEDHHCLTMIKRFPTT